MGTDVTRAAPLIALESPVLDEYDAFLEFFQAMFQSATYAQAAVSDLFRFKQGSLDIVTYVSKFQQVAASTNATIVHCTNYSVMD